MARASVAFSAVAGAAVSVFCFSAVSARGPNEGEPPRFDLVPAEIDVRFVSPQGASTSIDVKGLFLLDRTTGRAWRFRMNMDARPDATSKLDWIPIDSPK